MFFCTITEIQLSCLVVSLCTAYCNLPYNDSYDTKHLGCTYVPWFRNRSKKAITSLNVLHPITWLP